MATQGAADTRPKLIDPAIYLRGWTEAVIRRDSTHVFPLAQVYEGQLLLKMGEKCDDDGQFFTPPKEKSASSPFRVMMSAWRNSGVM